MRPSRPPRSVVPSIYIRVRILCIYKPSSPPPAPRRLPISISRSKMTFKTRVQGSLGELGISSDRGLSLRANSISGPNQIPCAAFTYRSQNPQSLRTSFPAVPTTIYIYMRTYIDRYIILHVLNRTFCSQNRDHTIPFSDMSCRVNTYSCSSPCPICERVPKVLEIITYPCIYIYYIHTLCDICNIHALL